MADEKTFDLHKKRSPKELMAVFSDYSVRNEEVRPVERTPTGILSVDEALWGGPPSGKISMIFGPMRTGKTTLSMLMARQFNERGLVVMWIDAENSFDKDYAQAMGWDTEKAQKDGLLYYFPYTENKVTAEKWLDTITMMVSSGIPHLIVVDSLAAIPTMAEANSSAEKANVATMARVLTPWLKSIGPDLASSKCVLLIINQERDSIGPYGGPAHFPGGKALGHHCHLILRTMSPEKATDGESITLRYKIEKTKVFPAPKPGTEYELKVTTGDVVEVDFISELFNAGVKYKFIVTEAGEEWKKNVGYLQDEQGELHKLGNGAKQMLQKLEDQALLDILKGRVFKRIGLLTDDQGQSEGSNEL